MNLVQLARKTLESYFEGIQFEPSKDIKKQFEKNQACFVTLTKRSNLRGCIGSLTVYRPLWKDVQNNVLNAAFCDPRFSPLQKSELHELQIEISVLSKPKKLTFNSPEDLLKKLKPSMGIVLKKSFSSSTFLPQVWEQLPNKVEFLENLSRKAGLSKDAWKTSEIYYYTVKIEKE